jgi:LCP family protein required for cell wall assembly
MTDPVRPQQRLLRHIAAARRARRLRLQILALTISSVLTLVLAGGSWALTSYISNSLGRVNAGTSGTPASGPINILVAGIDTRGGLTRHQEVQLHVGDSISENSDTLMLVHIPANHASIEVVSLPRDSWVNIPGHGLSKINAAFGLGGPQLMVKTVEQATGLDINDYVEVDFLGFVKVIDALGGVNICLPFAVNDHYSGLHLSAGRHHVDGVTALEFVRDRHSFALSDIARIGDQQQLLSSLLTEAMSSGLLADPIRLQEVLSSLTASIKVDNGFNVIRLAQELRGLRSQDVSFTTVPLASINYITQTGESAVLWDKAAAHVLFTRLRDDTGLPARQHRHKRSTLRRSQVPVDVYNGTLVGKLSADTGRELASLGFAVHKAGLNWPRHDVPATVIEYPPGHYDQAALVRAAMPGAGLRSVAGLARVRIVLGTAGHAVRGSSGSSPSQPGSAKAGTAKSAGPGQAHTAAQDACR